MASQKHKQCQQTYEIEQNLNIIASELLMKSAKTKYLIHQNESKCQTMKNVDLWELWKETLTQKEKQKI